MSSWAYDSWAARKRSALSIASAARRAISCASSRSGAPKRRPDSPVPSEIVPSSRPRASSGTTMYEIALERVVEREMLLVDRGVRERALARVLDEVRLAGS